MTCKLCGDRGLILKGEVAVPCGCLKQKTIEKLFKDSCLPKKLQDCTFERVNFRYYARDNIDPESGLSYYEMARLAFQAAQNFVKGLLKNEQPDGLLFTGQVGSGKTFLACCIANDLLKKGKTVLFAVVPDLLDQIRATFDSVKTPDEVSEFDIVETARQVPLLILDDLGSHNYTEWTRNKIYSIVNYRLNHSLPVIVTTNIKLDDLEEYLGERTTSRLLEMCRSYRLMVEIDIRAVRREEKETRALDIKY